ncbi:GGDEF domain-containing protein [Cellulomonas sp. ATA003]|uniref:GGDEF domain-containing protein n=1 Tax=Cellulomonas sp. ATA003 TaxID=3073064 RepID=UPI002872FD94|nr:GGDEF domain-containing protein [Cellulomonas sp. ATA003]WNB87176.1 GGDEF domain-containing protein [Cellulomonas sp. ATA003]
MVAADRDTARHAQDELAHRATHDPLTDLPTRWMFFERVTHAIASLARRPGHVGVLFLDLDALKEVNDTFGHDAGDRLLTTVAERVRGPCGRPTSWRASAVTSSSCCSRASRRRSRPARSPSASSTRCVRRTGRPGSR